MSTHEFSDELAVFFVPADPELEMKYKVIKRGYDELRKMIGGGYPEIVKTRLMPELPCGCMMVMVVDEDGGARHLPVNPRVQGYYPWQPIVGDAVILGQGMQKNRHSNPDVDFVSLPPEFNSWEGPGKPIPTPSPL